MVVYRTTTLVKKETTKILLLLLLLLLRSVKQFLKPRVTVRRTNNLKLLLLRSVKQFLKPRVTVRRTNNLKRTTAAQKKVGEYIAVTGTRQAKKLGKERATLGAA